MALELRPYQKEAVESVYSYFRSGSKGNPLIVAPTGSGKSLILGAFIVQTIQQWPNQKLLLLCHRKELIQQNYQKIIQLWPEAPVGVYSAGLKSRQLGRKVTVGGIASIYNKHEGLGWIDLVLCDECHLCPSDGEGMYRTLFDNLRKTNPNLKIIGLTATPYRLKTGMLTEEGGIYTDICYDIPIKQLVLDGYLAPLTSKVPKTQADLSNVKTRGGEYVAEDMERAMDDAALTEAAVNEMEVYLENRKSCMIFCAGVQHAQHVTEFLRLRGHVAECITGESDDMFRANTIARFRNGEIKFLVNVDVLTTGFDAPNVDGIILLRGTKSTGLYVQILGRGMRTHPGKADCMVLDFAGNILRHGPVDAITVKKKRAPNDEAVGKAPVKVCPQCQSSVLISAKICPDCGHAFPEEKPAHQAVATTAKVMVSIEPPQSFDVISVRYTKHEKEGKAPSMKVVYEVATNGGNLGRKFVAEWICLMHRGYAYQKAVEWWKEAIIYESSEIPMDIDEAINRSIELRKPEKIFVQPDGKFERVISRMYLDRDTWKKQVEAEGYEELKSKDPIDMEDLPF